MHQEGRIALTDTTHSPAPYDDVPGVERSRRQKPKRNYFFFAALRFVFLAAFAFFGAFAAFAFAFLFFAIAALLATVSGDVGIVPSRIDVHCHSDYYTTTEKAAYPLNNGYTRAPPHDDHTHREARRRIALRVLASSSSDADGNLRIT